MEEDSCNSSAETISWEHFCQIRRHPFSLVRGGTSVPEEVGKYSILFSSFCVAHSVNCRGSAVAFMCSLRPCLGVVNASRSARGYADSAGVHTLASSTVCLPWVSPCPLVGFNPYIWYIVLKFLPLFFLEYFCGAWYTGDFCHCGRFLRGHYHVLPCQCGTYYDAPWSEFSILFSICSDPRPEEMLLPTEDPVLRPSYH